MPLHDQIFPSNSLKTCVPVSKTNVELWCFNATFNNISVISWQSVLLVEEIGIPWENHRHATSQILTTQIWQSKHLYYFLTIFKGLIKHVWRHASTVESVFETGAHVKLAVNLKEKLRPWKHI